MAIGAYVEYTVGYLSSEQTRMGSVFAYLFLAISAYLTWFCLSGSVFHPIIRSLVGAYAERKNIQSGTTLYVTTDLEHILEKTENKKWLSDLCSMRVVDRKEEQDQIKLKLSKYNTNFFLSIYGRQLRSECFVSMTTYELVENLAEKVILVNDDCENSLKPQLSEFEHSLELKSTTANKPQILYNALNYAMSPARFPMLLKYRNQIMVSVVTSFAGMLVVLARLAGAVDDNLFLGALAILVALGSTAFTAIGRR